MRGAALFLQRASHRCPASTRSPAFATLAQYFASSSTVPSSCFFCLSCAKTPPTEPPWPRRFRRGVRRFSGVSSDIRRSALWWARCGMVLRIDQFCRRQCPALSWGLHPCAVLAAPRSGCVWGGSSTTVGILCVGREGLARAQRSTAAGVDAVRSVVLHSGCPPWVWRLVWGS